MTARVLGRRRLWLVALAGRRGGGERDARDESVAGAWAGSGDSLLQTTISDLEEG